MPINKNNIGKLEKEGLSATESKKKIVKFSTLVLSAFLILFLIIPVVSAASYELTVFVYDYNTGTPVSGASIYLDGSYKGTTNSDGEKQITGITGFAYSYITLTVTVKKSGYEDASQQVSVPSNDQITLNLKPKAKTFTLTVIAIDSDTGTAVSGALVSLDGISKGGTDSSGKRTIIGVSQGDHTVTVKKSGYDDASQQVSVSSNDQVTLNLKPKAKTYTITIIAIDSDMGTAVSGALVSLDGISKGGTDSSGKRTIIGVSQGDHTVTVKKSGYDDASQQVSVSSNDQVTLNLKQKAKTFTLTVTAKDYETGKPISNAILNLDGSYKGTTDSNGEKQITEVSQGWHKVTVKKSGYDDASQDVSISSYIQVIVQLKSKQSFIGVREVRRVSYNELPNEIKLEIPKEAWKGSAKAVIEWWARPITRIPGAIEETWDTIGNLVTLSEKGNKEGLKNIFIYQSGKLAATGVGDELGGNVYVVTYAALEIIGIIKDKKDPAIIATTIASYIGSGVASKLDEQIKDGWRLHEYPVPWYKDLTIIVVKVDGFASKNVYDLGTKWYYLDPATQTYILHKEALIRINITST